MTKQRKEKHSVSQCSPTPIVEDRWHVPSFADTAEKTTEAARALVQPSLSLSFTPRTAPQGAGAEGNGGGWQLMAHVLVLPSPSQCATLVTSVCTLMALPWTRSIFSHLWDCSLNTRPWEDWQLPDRVGGHPRWVLNHSANREREHMSLGRFPNHLPIGGIVYFLHISRRVHLWAPFTTSNRQVGKDMALKIRWWLINGLAKGFNTQTNNYLCYSLNCQRLFSNINTNTLLSIFVNTANRFILFLAPFPLLDRVINRAFHLARLSSMASERRFYTDCSKTAHTWHISLQTLLTFTLPSAYFSLDFTLKMACSSDTHQRLGCLDIWKKNKERKEEQNMKEHSSHFWSQALNACNSTTIYKNDLRWLPLRSISMLRS